MCLAGSEVDQQVSGLINQPPHCTCVTSAWHKRIRMIGSMPLVRTHVLSREFQNYALNTKFVDAVGMQRKTNRHSKDETISTLFPNVAKKNFTCKFKTLT